MTIHPNTLDATPTASPTWHSISVIAARVLSGLFAGFFLTYAMSVIAGLRRVDDVTYVATFQAINETVRSPAFAVVFFGALPVTIGAAFLHRGVDRRMLGAGAAFLFATMAITFVFNVPLNNELATYVDVDAASAATARADFEDSWNRWNLARTCTALIGALLVATAVRSVRGNATATVAVDDHALTTS